MIVLPGVIVQIMLDIINLKEVRVLDFEENVT